LPVFPIRCFSKPDHSGHAGGSEPIAEGGSCESKSWLSGEFEKLADSPRTSYEVLIEENLHHREVLTGRVRAGWLFLTQCFDGRYPRRAQRREQ
jgi:hypothetical protein